MNLRFSEDSIRFRITRAELERLLQSGELSQVTWLPDGKNLTYRVLISPETAIGLSLEWRDNEIILFAPSFQLQDMLARPRSKTLAKDLGCYQDVPVAENRLLRVVLEVDLFSERKSSHRDSARKATFPNRP